MAPEAPTPTTNPGANAKETADANTPVTRNTARVEARPMSRSSVVPKIHRT